MVFLVSGGIFRDWTKGQTPLRWQDRHIIPAETCHALLRMSGFTDMDSALRRCTVRGVVSLCFAIAIACLSPAQACADDAQDCKALVERAAEMFKQQGKEAALKAIDSNNGALVKGELYVFALSSVDNAMLAHPHEKTLKRLKMDNFKDSNGKEFFKEFREVAVNKGSGWVEYTWAKPGAKEPSPKRSYIMKVPGEDIYIGAGYYVK